MMLSGSAFTSSVTIQSKLKLFLISVMHLLRYTLHACGLRHGFCYVDGFSFAHSSKLHTRARLPIASMKPNTRRFYKSNLFTRHHLFIFYVFLSYFTHRALATYRWRRSQRYTANRFATASLHPAPRSLMHLNLNNNKCFGVVCTVHCTRI